MRALRRAVAQRSDRKNQIEVIMRRVMARSRQTCNKPCEERAEPCVSVRTQAARTTTKLALLPVMAHGETDVDSVRTKNAARSRGTRR
uniref:Uncharacterized protein n=1 Tax=uncultured bacterium A1Q1_fos_291 TaxID=1256570 RepID=L7VWV4_9BACT|nr:hypothetical protein [uncultured bacterium A1Q1_fos_291]